MSCPCCDGQTVHEPYRGADSGDDLYDEFGPPTPELIAGARRHADKLEHSSFDLPHTVAYLRELADALAIYLERDRCPLRTVIGEPPT